MRLQLFLLIVLTIACSFPAAAQFNMVKETEQSMSFGTRPGFSVDFPNTEKRVVEGAWNDFVKNNFSGKLKRGKKGEKSATNCSSARVSPNRFTLYSKFERVGDGTQLNVWFDLGPHFLNRRDDPGQANEVKEVLTDFYYDVRRAVVGLELKAEEKAMKDLENKLKKLERENNNLNSNIETYKSRLKKAEEDLVQNQKDQEAALIDIDKQRTQLEQARIRQGNVENERQ